MTTNQTQAPKHIVIPEQEEILNSKGKNLIVSASAGSGKTSVMIRKIFNHILNKDCKVSELLVLTYTKSAASEMKKKLVDKLRDNVDKYDFLNQELEDVYTSDISTFDSFCQKLVKKYFYVLDIDPSFNVLTGGEQSYEEGICINRAIKELKKLAPNYYEILLQNFSPKRDEEQIKQIVLQVYNYSTSILDFDEFIKKSQNFYKKDQKIAENFLIFYYRPIFLQIKNNLENLKLRCSSLGFDKYVVYANNLVIVLESLILQKSFAKLVDSLNDINYGVLRQDKNDEIGLKELLAKEKTKLQDVLKAMKENFVSGEVIENSYEPCAEMLDAIIYLTRLFIEKYTAKKKQINCYDFNDIERLTIKILEDEQINAIVKNSYKYIFVDEFQDANAVQEKIIFLLQNNNLFFVGDTKQSIYAFRQSDPEIFLNIEKDFKKSDLAEAKRLNCNFRTNKHILNFVNEIFNVIMTEKTAGINYKKFAQFDPKAPYEDLPNDVNVTLNLICSKPDLPKLAPKSVYSVKDNVNQALKSGEHADECLFVCEHIAELIGQDIYDKDLGKTRKIDFNDITILLTKRSSFLNELVKHMQELGIPYVVNANNNLEEVYDNMVLYNMLKLCQNSCDDFALYAVLVSELFGFSDEELAVIKNNFADCKFFYEACEAYLQNDDELANKIKKFYSSLKEFAFNVKHKGIFFALNNLIVSTNYLLKISFEDDGQTRALNVNEYIGSFANSKYNQDLCAYLIYRETALRQEKMVADKQTVNAVQITTMHASKGLEYPVVILPNLDANYLKSPEHSEVKINKELGIGIKTFLQEERVVNKGIFFESARLKNKQTEQSEKIRLLYVAMTRAKNKLIMVGKNTQNYSQLCDDYEILACNNYLSLIVGALEPDIINKINDGEVFAGTLFKNERLKINSVLVEDVSFSCKSVASALGCNKETINALGEFLSKGYNTSGNKIALKNSVSELAYDENASLNFAPQTLEVSEHLKQKASERGTMYHAVLEQINFNDVNSESDVKQFVECNFTQEEINTLQGVTYQNIYNNICLIKKHINPTDKVLKEQKFVMQVPYSQVANSTNADNVLIQGIIDLMIIKQNEIVLIDYKLSSRSNQELKEKYAKQIMLYNLAISKGFNNFLIKKYILNLNKNELILM